MTFFLGGGGWAFYVRKTTGRRPKTLPKKSYSKCWGGHRLVRCSKLEPFCGTEKWAHLANLGWNDPNAHAKINESSPNSLARVQFQNALNFHQNLLRSQPGKPNQKKASSWTFPRGIPEQKFDVNRACFPKENTRIPKNGRNSWTFRFGPFFGLVAGGDSWFAKFPPKFAKLAKFRFTKGL